MYKVLSLLLLINTSQIGARGRIPILRTNENDTIDDAFASSTTERLSLPQGFNPQPSPMNPLLYPFVTEQTPINRYGSTTQDWKPILAQKTTTRTTPMLRDRVGSSIETQENSSPIENTFTESVIYGTWKPDISKQPNIDQVQDSELSASKELSSDVFTKKLGADQVFESPINTDSNESSPNSSKQNAKKVGRRKIPADISTEPKNSVEKNSKTSMEIIKFNTSDPHSDPDGELFKMAKQINESVETNNGIKTKSTENLAATDQRSKEWPTDFINSPEANQPQDNSEQQLNFLGDSPDPPIDTTSSNTDSSNSFNITRLGVPFESSMQEPSICVPLAVRERSASNPNEIVEVERIYCFPLPVPPAPPSPDLSNSFDDNSTLILDRDVQFNVLNYEELSVSKSSKFFCSLWIGCIFRYLVFN